MSKILLFERAGMNLQDMNDVGTGRIRTAFRTDDGKRIYLELIAGRKQKQSSPTIYQWERTGFVMDCFYITDEKPNDDCNKHRFPTDQLPRCFEWSLDNIRNIVRKIGGDFDGVAVVPHSTYRVFNDLGGYNYGDGSK